MTVLDYLQINKKFQFKIIGDFYIGFTHKTLILSLQK